MMYYLKCPLPAFLKSLRAPPNNCNNIPFLMSTFSYILGAREREREKEEVGVPVHNSILEIVIGT